jgi:hypothetical protein
MTRRHGVTKETPKRFVIDSGAVYKDYGLAGETLLGATRDGNTFTLNQEIRNMPVDGARGKVKGHDRPINVEPVIVANFVEMTADQFVRAIVGANREAYPSYAGKTHTLITRDLDKIRSGLDTETGDDYMDNITIVGQVSGTNKPIVIGIENVIADGNIEINTVDEDESVLSVTFSARFDASDLDDEPWFVRFPKIPTES